MSTTVTADNATPGLPAQPGDLKTWIVYLVRELGLTTMLVVFVCYLLAVQLPAMQVDFRAQTDKLVEAVNNGNRVISENNRVITDNSRAITELVFEVRSLRKERQ